MDSLTQAVLGASVAAAIAPKSVRKKALLMGGILGTLPDLDVFLRYSNDIENFIRHRGFSHSLLVLPLVALVLLPLFKRFFKSLSWGRSYFIIASSLMTHPLLDAFTTYGTQLFYPFNVTPTFISSVFIVDPLYTFWLLLGGSFYLASSRFKWLNTLGLTMSTLYLLLGVGLQHMAKRELLKGFPETKRKDWSLGVLNASPFCWRAVLKKEGTYTEVAFNILRPEQKAVQEYKILPPSFYPESSKLKKLQWFNPKTVLRKRGEFLVSSDLRMGEFGSYFFEFMIWPDEKSGGQLPRESKTKWKPFKENSWSADYQRNNAQTSLPKRKWRQFLRCLAGDF